MGHKRNIFLCLLLTALALGPAWAATAELSEYGNPITTVTVGPVTIKAEVVDTPEKLYLGLGHRKALDPGRGMLFVMPARETQVFCMRGMQFPLDILWLRPGRVAGLAKNIAADFPGEIISPEPVQYVLEVPAGFCDRHGVKRGDRASW